MSATPPTSAWTLPRMYCRKTHLAYARTRYLRRLHCLSIRFALMVIKEEEEKEEVEVVACLRVVRRIVIQTCIRWMMMFRLRRRCDRRFVRSGCLATRMTGAMMTRRHQRRGRLTWKCRTSRCQRRALSRRLRRKSVGGSMKMMMVFVVVIMAIAMGVQMVKLVLVVVILYGRCLHPGRAQTWTSYPAAPCSSPSLARRA